MGGYVLGPKGDHTTIVQISGQMLNRVLVTYLYIYILVLVSTIIKEDSFYNIWQLISCQRPTAGQHALAQP